ncbi:Regulatory-associated protein of TOR 1 [Acorus calamus]|uniref:Regulatory-associated protein of TOR 1 n=1 Tax=Acorus calamus TaxID=4465 RepID=A0AAV9EFV9_ACOCL|nr:Regulatory-associated protein of TOR 1 [Acorus calamus]
MTAFVLALIVDRHHEGLGACIQAGLIPVCLRRLQLANPHDAQAEPLLCQWLCLCLGKLWEDFPEAQMIGLQADAPATFASLLSKSQPEVRAAAVFALGMLLDVGNDSLRDETGVDDECDDDEKTQGEPIIVKSLLEVVADGSPMVRAEVVVALARFAFVHNKHLKPIAAAYWKPQPNRLLTSLSSLPNIKIPNYGYRSVGQYTHSGSPVLRIGSDRTSSGLRGRVSMSSPLASTGIMCGSPQSNDSSQHSDSGVLLKDHASSGDTNFSRSKPLDNTMYTQCVLAMCTLAKDPSPRIANLGQRMLSMIGIKQVVTKALQPDGPIHPGDSPATSPAPSLHGPARSPSSWDMTAGHSPLTFRTPPVSPPRQSLTGMRRVSSLEFSPLWMNSPNLGLADPILGLGGPGSECSLLPNQQSTTGVVIISQGHPLQLQMMKRKYLQKVKSMKDML